MAKKAVLIFGVIMTLIGVIGFFNDPVIGLFEVDTFHNLIHLLTGIIAIGVAIKGEVAAQSFAKIFGILYLLLGVIGLFWPNDLFLGLIEINLADDILHIVLGVSLLFIGYKK